MRRKFKEAHRLNIQFDNNEYLAIEEIANRQTRSFASVVREAVIFWLEHKDTKVQELLERNR